MFMILRLIAADRSFPLLPGSRSGPSRGGQGLLSGLRPGMAHGPADPTWHTRRVLLRPQEPHTVKAGSSVPHCHGAGPVNSRVATRSDEVTGAGRPSMPVPYRPRLRLAYARALSRR